MPLASSVTDQLADEILEKISNYSSEIDVKNIEDAYEFAKKAHRGQLRKSGEQYLIHPLRTVSILTNLHVDEDTLIAGLLHDVPEDTQVPLKKIEEKFGSTVAYLVDGVTKLSKMQYRERMAERQIESLKKLFVHSAEDLRALIIKLADRTDNMRTLQFIANDQKRNRIARETMEIYVPLANLLGIGEIRAELEDLAFQHLHPLEYAELQREIEENIEERNFILDEMIRFTEKELNKNKMEAEILGRPKTLYSIFKKLDVKHSLKNIDDIIAIRIIVPAKKDCYQTLGIIHKLFKPTVGRIKDYIAVPKPNGYQSLHTTVFGINGSMVEFQVRTRYMHLEAEYGVAAHYFYKTNKSQELAEIMRQRSNWVQKILDIQKDQKDPHDFMHDLKLDIFQDRIFVFSPKGDVIDLPRGACVLDFAYAIHSDLGHHAARAEINGHVSSIITTLGSGDNVKVISNTEVMPDREWLSHAKTALAINKIKEFLKSESSEKKISAGRRFLQKEFDKIGKNFMDVLTHKKIKMILGKLGFRRLDEILCAIGEGTLNPQNILATLYEEKMLDKEAMGYFKKKISAGKQAIAYPIHINVLGDNSNNQFREIFRTLNALKVPVNEFVIDKPAYLNSDRCKLKLLIRNYNELSQVFESLERLENVTKVYRTFFKRKLLFLVSIMATAVLWLIHPIFIYMVAIHIPFAETLSILAEFAGFSMLFGLIYYIHRIAHRSFPELEETKYYWPAMLILSTLAFFTIIQEIITLKLNFKWIFLLGLIIIVYAFLATSYLSYKQRHQ